MDRKRAMLLRRRAAAARQPGQGDDHRPGAADDGPGRAGEAALTHPLPPPSKGRGEIGGTVRICLPQLLNVAAMDQSGNMQNRGSRRAPVLLAATVEVRGAP